MKRGPKPIGDHTMTAAERQARYRTVARIRTKSSHMGSFGGLTA